MGDGTCADQGYTVQTGTQTKSYPVIGDIVITTYSKGALKVADTCSLYEIGDGQCGQSDLDCAYVKYAKAAEKALADGTCADQGYTVQTGTQTRTYPIIGDIVITTYSKGLAAKDTCSLFQLADGTCADQGYTVQTGTQTRIYPIIGDIVITTYSKGLAAKDTCSLF